MVYKQFPGIRGELQGGVLEGFDLIFGEFSDIFSDEISATNPRTIIYWVKKIKKYHGELHIRDPRPLQLAIYTVFHEESESEVKNAQLQEEK